MEIVLIVAFVAFFAMVAVWMAAPSGRKPKAVETGTLSVGEARV